MSVSQQTEKDVHKDEQEDGQAQHTKRILDESASHAARSIKLPLQ
jgi:hypothetical protein